MRKRCRGGARGRARAGRRMQARAHVQGLASLERTSCVNITIASSDLARPCKRRANRCGCYRLARRIESLPPSARASARALTFTYHRFYIAFCRQAGAHIRLAKSADVERGGEQVARGLSVSGRFLQGLVASGRSRFPIASSKSSLEVVSDVRS